MKPDRRRLLRGSLAAPLVLTVRPASATGITSAAACLDRCDIRAHETKPRKLSSALHSDEWLRIEIDEWRLAPSYGKPYYSGKYFLGFDKVTYWRLDDRDPYNYPAQPSTYTKGSCYAEKTGRKLYPLTYVNRTGEVKGYAWENNWGGKHATWSCYTSAVGLKHKT